MPRVLRDAPRAGWPEDHRRASWAHQGGGEPAPSGDRRASAVASARRGQPACACRWACRGALEHQDVRGAVRLCCCHRVGSACRRVQGCCRCDRTGLQAASGPQGDRGVWVHRDVRIHRRRCAWGHRDGSACPVSVPLRDRLRLDGGAGACPPARDAGWGVWGFLPSQERQDVTENRAAGWLAVASAFVRLAWRRSEVDRIVHLQAEAWVPLAVVSVVPVKVWLPRGLPSGAVAGQRAWRPGACSPPPAWPRVLPPAWPLPVSGWPPWQQGWAGAEGCSVWPRPLACSGSLAWRAPPVWPVLLPELQQQAVRGDFAVWPQPLVSRPVSRQLAWRALLVPLLFSLTGWLCRLLVWPELHWKLLIPSQASSGCDQLRHH